MINLYHNQQLRNFENQLYTRGICNATQLMQNAGKAAFHVLLQRWPEARHIIICCGKGNNGGDGLVVAQLAQQYGLKVSVYSTALNHQEYSIAANYALKQAQSAGIELKSFAEFELHLQNTDADVIVDALLGSGLVGDVREPYNKIIQAINDSTIPVLAIDVPSGLNSDTGQVLGCAIYADATITFIGLKQGLLTGAAPGYCGQLLFDSIDIPPAEFIQLKPSAQQLTWEDVRPRLLRRSRNTHKGDYGHVLVIGGDYGMGGAVRMSAEAAMRVGAGLVSVATRPEHVSIVSCNRPEIMCHQIATSEDLPPLLERASVIVIGPGLGKSNWSQSLLNMVLQKNTLKVIDADALNLLATSSMYRDDWVLTPHPGEASRLLNISTQEVQQNRFHAAQQLQQRYGGVVILKGVGSLIQAIDTLPLLCGAGNPGMATGGMGDILSGVIGGLLAQHLTLLEAAKVGVMIHSLAADKAAQQGGERGLLACDLLGYLRELVNPI